MAGRSVKELADEIDSLSIIDLSKLEEALEEKFGISRKLQNSDWVDDKVFVMGYDIKITAEYNGIAEKVQLMKNLCNSFSFSLNEAKDFIADLPQTIAYLQPCDDALEIQKKYMEAGFTVELKWTWGYLSHYKFSSCYNAHQQHQLINFISIEDL